VIGYRESLSVQVHGNRYRERSCRFFVAISANVSCHEIVTMIKSISARAVFRRCPKVKKLLWGGEMWMDGYYAGTVGKYGNEDMIGKYVKGQGGTYQKLYSDYQLSLF